MISISTWDGNSAIFQRQIQKGVLIPMCGRFTLTAEQKAFAARFGIELPRGFYSMTGRYNVAPTQTVIVIGDDGKRYVEQMKWGLIPAWAKDPAIGNHLINARAETVAEKPSFRSALKKRRCLIVADGFYEWQKLEKVKQPVHIVLKNRQPFGFAGLWERWKSPEGEEIKSCVIITTEANELLKALHDRMPVILPQEDEPRWLDPKVDDPQLLLPLLKPYPPDKMEFYPVSTLVNSPKHDSENCIVPLTSA